MLFFRPPRIPLPEKRMGRIYDEDVCCCALNRIFGFKPKVANAMIGHIGSASGIFRLRPHELDSITGAFSPYRALITEKTLEESARELDSLYSRGYHFLHITSEDYPALLKECDDPPVGLYVRSTSSPAGIFSGRPSVSVVGTRDISSYGREWCTRIVSALCRASPAPSVISGLAIGTDVTAHSTALACGAGTIAVMATGIDAVYPARHRKIADEIASTPGCALITDYPPGTSPLRINFLRRNRIIAGLSMATVLIESKAKGGGMLTARLAFSYERDVYALPGRADDRMSQGCNILIKEKVAEPVVSAESLAESIGLRPSGISTCTDPLSAIRKAADGHYSMDIIDILSRIVLMVKNRRGITVDEIASESGITYKKALEYTAMLESDSIIYTDLMQRCYIRLK